MEAECNERQTVLGAQGVFVDGRRKSGVTLAERREMTKPEPNWCLENRIRERVPFPRAIFPDCISKGLVSVVGAKCKTGGRERCEFRGDLKVRMGHGDMKAAAVNRCTDWVPMGCVAVTGEERLT